MFLSLIVIELRFVEQATKLVDSISQKFAAQLNSTSAAKTEPQQPQQQLVPPLQPQQLQQQQQPQIQPQSRKSEEIPAVKFTQQIFKDLVKSTPETKIKEIIPDPLTTNTEIK